MWCAAGAVSGASVIAVEELLLLLLLELNANLTWLPPTGATALFFFVLDEDAGALWLWKLPPPSASDELATPMVRGFE